MTHLGYTRVRSPRRSMITANGFALNSRLMLARGCAVTAGL